MWNECRFGALIMDFTSVKLVNDASGVAEAVCVTSGGITFTIPFDPGNRDYQKYLEWVAEGNTPTPAD